MSISAMKQALDALTYIHTETTEYEEKVMDEAIAVLEQAIAEAEKQEPVAFVSGLYNAPVHASDISQERVDETAKDKHEDWYGQHQWQCGYERGWDAAMEKREWVGLTDEEIKKEQHHIDWTSAHTYAKFARAIEAKLKEKNT
jgi:hypothetical protein